MPEPIEDVAWAEPPERRLVHSSRASRWLSDVALTPQIALGIATSVASLVTIAILTLVPMGRDLPDHFDVCILCGRYGTADFALNVMLFIPLGFGLRLAGVRRRWAWLFAAALTCTIEALQFFVVPGRDSDLSDIIANSLGAAIGIALADGRRHLMVPTSQTAHRLVAASVLVCCLGTACLQWALTPTLPGTIYYWQNVAQFPHWGVFNGTLYEATFNGVSFRSGRLTADSSAAIRTALLTGNATIAGSIRADAQPTRLAAIISVFDRRRLEIFVLGRRVDDLAFRLRRRTDNLGFHTPSAVLTNALTTSSAADDTLRISATIDRPGGTVVLATERHNARIQRRIGLGIWDAWRLFVPDDGRFGRYDAMWTLVTMAALWLPLGYWAGRSARGAATLLSAAGSVVALAVALAIIPWMAASLPAPAWIWVVSLAVLGTAWMFSRWTHT